MNPVCYFAAGLSLPRSASALVYHGAMTIGARQNVAFDVAGSSTVTWQSYRPGASRLVPRSKLSGTTPSRVAALGSTAIGAVLNTSAPAEYRLTKASNGCVPGGAPSGCGL